MALRTDWYEIRSCRGAVDSFKELHQETNQRYSLDGFTLKSKQKIFDDYVYKG
jgi:hypothetical protein